MTVKSDCNVHLRITVIYLNYALYITVICAVNKVYKN